MKKFLPYVRLLIPFKYHLLAGMLCGVVYGAMSGFAVPVIIDQILPRLFEKETQITEDNVKNVGSFVQKLREPSDPVSVYLHEHLYPETRRLLEQYNDSESSQERVKTALVKELNKIIQLNSLYDEQRFAGVELSERTRRLIEEKPEKDEDRFRLNRLLLEDSYPAELGRRTEPSSWDILMTVGWLPGAFLVRASCGFASLYLINFCGMSVLQKIRLQFFEKLQMLPYAYFSRMRSGDLLSRFNNDTARLQTTLITVTNDIIRQPVTLVGALCAIVYLAIKYEAALFILLSLLVFPACVFPVRIIGKKLLKKAQLTQTEIGNLSECVTENLATYSEVRAFNLQETQTRKFHEVADAYLRQTMKVIKYSKILSPIIEVISVTIIALAIAFAAKTGLHYGAIMALVAALYMSYEPVKRLAAVYSEYKVGLASLERLEETLDEPEEHDDGTMVPESVRGRIEFSNVSFRYKDEPVLKQISVRIEPGQIVALVGPSGAGKSTFVGLIPRFYDPVEGSVSLDGTPLDQIKRSGLRAHIAIVSQTPVLFNTSLYENILVGDPHASREEVVQAARKAHAHEFISSFDQGYETRVGERGGQLSGGQRQRIAIARAFLKDAPILILDEATSALDSESEQLIQESLNELFQRKTVFIIAHRFSTIRQANRILVFESGRIIADGTHDQLLQTSPLYEKLYSHQFNL